MSNQCSGCQSPTRSTGWCPKCRMFSRVCECGTAFLANGHTAIRCLECNRRRRNKYHYQWHKQNDDPEKRRQWDRTAKKRKRARMRQDPESPLYDKHKERVRQANHKRLRTLSGQLAAAFYRTRIGKSDPDTDMGRSPRRVGLEHTITKQDVVDLWERQGGKCALTGMAMEYEPQSPKCISVDRIENSVGYIPSNIQLVCKWVNHAKNKMSNDQIRALLAEVVELREVQRYSGSS